MIQWTPSLSSHELGGGNHLPFLVRDATVHFRTEKKKKKVWILSSAGLSHEGCLWWDCRLCSQCPELVPPFPLSPLLQVPWKQHRGGAGGAQRVQRNVRAIRGSAGGLGWRAGITQVTREKLQNSSGEVWVTQRTPAGGCPSLVFTSPGTGTSGKTNAAMACPARALGNKAE